MEEIKELPYGTTIYFELKRCFNCWHTNSIESNKCSECGHTFLRKASQEEINQKIKEVQMRKSK